ncbi:acetolactate synthase 2 small subunit [Flocculibacter collagenilyticus]|uniref:acetolactate synthase 2 small subunit n=1 Tax=Flocculibacter collagenilyticus TaxID=2744479 RepID=UPI0018F2F360|nr:acetolactate synthase 2 small subunit [Flocculibacter collagenilyticus]
MNNQQSLTILAHQTPAALERILQTMRFRGFQLLQLTTQQVLIANEYQQDDQQMLLISVTVTSNHAIHLLTHQLEKLFDVATVNVLDTQPTLEKMSNTMDIATINSRTTNVALALRS